MRKINNTLKPRIDEKIDLIKIQSNVFKEDELRSKWKHSH